MAEHNIEVKGKVDFDVQPTIAELKKLQKELKTTSDPQRFKELQQQIDDTKEAIAAAKSGAGNFAEVLGELPGPIGEIGNKAGGLIATLKQFGQLKPGDLKTSFVELGKDISDVAKGIGNLTGITKVYNTIAGISEKVLKAVGVAEQSAAVGAKAFSAALTATGIGLVVVALTALVQQLSELVSGEEEAKRAAEDLNRTLESQKELFDLNQKSAENRRKVVIAQMKAQGKDEKEIRQYSIKEAYSDYTRAYDAEVEARKTYNQRINKADAEGRKKLQDNLDAATQRTKDAYASYLETGYNSRAEDLKNQQAANAKSQAAALANAQKLAAIRKQEMDELTKGQEDAFKATLTEQAKEQYEVNKKYNHLIHLAEKYGKDTKGLKEGQRIELKAIDDKYDKQAADKAKEDADKAKADRKEQFDKEKAELDLQRAKKLIDEDTYQANLKALREQYAEGEVDKINAQIDYLNFLSDKKDKELEKDKERAKEQEEINKQVKQSWIDLGSNIGKTFTELGQLFEEGSDMAKTFGIVSVLINAATAIAKINLDFSEAISSKRKAISVATDAIASGTAMLPLNPIVGGALIASGTASLTASSAGLAVLQANKGLQIASVAITSGAQIAAILSAKKSGQVSSNATASGGGSTMPAPSYGGTPSLSTPQIQTTGGANPATQIGQTIQQASMNPVRAYVVSQDIQTQTALDRRTNKAATFGLG